MEPDDKMENPLRSNARNVLPNCPLFMMRFLPLLPEPEDVSEEDPDDEDELDEDTDVSDVLLDELLLLESDDELEELG